MKNMRHLLEVTILASSLGLTSVVASAQVDREYSPQREQAQDRIVSQAFDRMRADLDLADSHAAPFVSDVTGDRARIDRARQEVNEFEQSWNAGNFDPNQLQDAIVAVQRVLNENRLLTRDRDLLLSDMKWTEEFQASEGR